MDCLPFGITGKYYFRIEIAKFPPTIILDSWNEQRLLEESALDVRQVRMQIEPRTCLIPLAQTVDYITSTFLAEE